MDYAMLSRYSIQSTSDQEDYVRYATILASQEGTAERMGRRRSGHPPRRGVPVQIHLPRLHLNSLLSGLIL